MTEALDLGDFEDEALAPIDGENADVSIDPKRVLCELGDDHAKGPGAQMLAELFVNSQRAAALPKPTIKEMIAEVLRACNEIENVELRWTAVGHLPEPRKPNMRRAAVLAATVNFLELISANQAAVRSALTSRKQK